MRLIVISRDDLFFRILKGIDEAVFVFSEKRMQKRSCGQGARARCGDLSDADTYRKLSLTQEDRIIVSAPELSACRKIIRAVRAASENLSITAFVDGIDGVELSEDAGDRFVPTKTLSHGGVLAEVEKTVTLAGIRALYPLFENQERVLILVQDDPDPDGIASALALRTLLGRNKQTAPIGSFGRVTRPENQMMVKLLNIEISRITSRTLKGFDRIAMVDTQPSHLKNKSVRADIIIDHHPTKGSEAFFKDIRAHYGATSTILTEYLTAANIKISQRLATALLYGIKTDTLLLDRETIQHDVNAFAMLYQLANRSLIRRMDRPQIPARDVDALSKALKKRRIIQDVCFSHLGELSSADLVPHIADFCLEIEGVEWSVVSGTFRNDLVISVRTYGTGKSAGEAAKTAFGEWGNAGGHRTMAKAIIPLENLKGGARRSLAKWLTEAFMTAYLEK